MKYSCELTLDVPRDQAWKMLEDPENMVKWQEGFLGYELTGGEPGHAGSTMALRYKMGKGELEMVETVVENRGPEFFSATYEAKNVWNIVSNTFTEVGDSQTHWVCETEFRCKGFMKLMMWITPGMFRKQTKKFMENFKRFAETGEGLN